MVNTKLPLSGSATPVDLEHSRAGKRAARIFVTADVSVGTCNDEAELRRLAMLSLTGR